MIPSDDILTGLPTPLDDEPPSVRQDIADELADHLACAYRRELFKTVDEHAAQQRVLDRFGNPQRIAYQLWFQALWGRIMLSRFARVWHGLKIVAGLAVLFLVFRMAEQQSALYRQLQFITASYNSMQSQSMGNRMLLEQMLSRLPAPPQSPDAGGMGGGMGMMMGADGSMSAGMAPGAMSSVSMGDAGGSMGMAGMPGAPSAQATSQAGLTLRLTMEGDDNKPAVGCVVAVVDEDSNMLKASIPDLAIPGWGDMGGSAMSPGAGMPGGMGMSATKTMRQLPPPLHKIGVELTSTHRGEIHFPSVEPGRYKIYVEFPDGRQSQRLIVIPPSSKTVSHTEQIVCPAPGQNAFVVFHAPILPQELIDAGFSVVASVKRKATAIEGTVWESGNNADDLYITFDPKTGAPLRYNRNSGNFTSFANYFLYGGQKSETSFEKLAAKDRFLKVASGEHEVTLVWWDNKAQALVSQITPVTIEDGEQPEIHFGYAATGATENGVLTIYADTRDVLLDLPKEMLDASRSVLEERFAGDKAAISGPAANEELAAPKSTPSNSESTKP